MHVDHIEHERNDEKPNAEFGTTFVVYGNKRGFLTKDLSWNFDVVKASQFADWASANSARLKALDSDPGDNEFVSVFEWT